MEWLRGKKTYILAAAALMTVLGRYLHGDVDVGGAINETLVALGLITARVGTVKSKGARS